MNKIQITFLAIYAICIALGWLYGLNSSYQKLYPTIEPHIQKNHYEKFDAFLFKCFAYGVIGMEGSVQGLALGLLSPILMPIYGVYSVMQ
uniref:Uncharacterized protein n=1 Tax=viral metagenome TaxID=1070528 RepID=A0A6C0CAV7_9ZZZZ